jgi:hypothetical protein
MALANKITTRTGIGGGSSLLGILRTPRIGQTYRELVLNVPRTKTDQNTNTLKDKTGNKGEGNPQNVPVRHP